MFQWIKSKIWCSCCKRFCNIIWKVVNYISITVDVLSAEFRHELIKSQQLIRRSRRASCVAKSRKRRWIQLFIRSYETKYLRSSNVTESFYHKVIQDHSASDCSTWLIFLESFWASSSSSSFKKFVFVQDVEKSSSNAQTSDYKFWISY